MERFFTDPNTLERFRSSLLGSHIDQLANDLLAFGYTRKTIRYHLRIVEHFGRWLKRRRRSTEDITDQDVARYVDQRGCVRNGDASALRRIVELLRERGIVPKRPTGVLTPGQKIIDGFSCYLQQERALAPSTIIYYRRHASEFLRARFGDAQVEFSLLSAGDVVNFVRTQAVAARSDAIKNVTHALRSFLTYARCRGLICLDLAAAVPSVANWWLSTVPKSLPHADVVRVLKSCDRKTALGQRDYAILLLLARLGLRASEVGLLALDDIDWEGGRITVHGKGGKLCELPLPADVGKAIATYVRKGRPQAATRTVFVRAAAPLGGFQQPRCVGTIVKRALARAGVKSARKGAHQLRHALACQMLRHGASLVEIGQVLRHESPHTTAIYAKVDFASLQPLAQPWPGRAK
jgi:site-specific recombinase XerD